jgi:hypothetical protein
MLFAFIPERPGFVPIRFRSASRSIGGTASAGRATAVRRKRSILNQVRQITQTQINQGRGGRSATKTYNISMLNRTLVIPIDKVGYKFAKNLSFLRFWAA